MPAPALTALQEAEAIPIGPGDLEDEILPVLIPLADALRTSSAGKFFIAPVAAPRREGRAANLGEVVSTIHRAADGPLLDVVLANTNLAPPLPDPDLAYVVVDEPALRAPGVEVVGRDLVDWSVPTRHDIHKLAAWLQDIVWKPAWKASPWGWESIWATDTSTGPSAGLRACPERSEGTRLSTSQEQVRVSDLEKLACRSDAAGRCGPTGAVRWVRRAGQRTVVTQGLP